MKQPLCIVSLSFLIVALYGTEEIIPGVYYQHLQSKKPLALSIHLLKIDPKQAPIIIGAADDKCASSATTSHIAQRLNGVAAINGSFFEFGVNNSWHENCIKILDALTSIHAYKAYPHYALKIDNTWFAASNTMTGILGWKNGGASAVMGAFKTTWHLECAGTNYPIAQINKPFADGPILYTAAYDSVTPQQANRVIEILIEDDIVLTTKIGYGSTPIPVRGYVYTMDYNYAHNVTHLPNGFVKIVCDYEMHDEYNPDVEWTGMEYLIGSTPLLVYNNELTKNVLQSTSEFYVKRHPRTAVGILPDGNWLMVVVDGRQSHSEGLTLLELAQFMHYCGCDYALNLDGGGSSTMVINDKLVNSPSGRSYSLFSGAWAERAISHALVVGV